MSSPVIHTDNRPSFTRSVIIVSVVTFLVLLSVLAASQSSLAGHESDNKLVFAPVDGSPLPNASGNGVVEYRGGAEPESMWTAAFQFSNLTPSSSYSLVIQGRFGEDGSGDATAYTEICSFVTNASGDGGCWFYFVGLRRLGVAQLRQEAAEGEPILQATRKEGGQGSISSTTNDYSCALTATPTDNRNNDRAGATAESEPTTAIPATP